MGTLLLLVYLVLGIILLYGLGLIFFTGIYGNENNKIMENLEKFDRGKNKTKEK